MAVIDERFPDWPDRVVHESSPAPRGDSARLRSACARYLPTQFFPDAEPGSMRHGIRCENLEALTFEDGSIDLHVTQDVLEHVAEPARVFAEIARTLRPGGAHVFTVPLIRRHLPTRPRARRRADGTLEHLEPPEYHGNPIDPGGSLVITDWGFDIGRHIFEASGLYTEVISIDDLTRGIRAELNEVLITWKPPAA